MGYFEYTKNFQQFNTLSGYYLAANQLLIKSDWKQFEQYKGLIRKSIETTSKRLDKQALDGADICCGDYAWLSRHFRSSFGRIYCVDSNEQALKSEAIAANEKCIPVNGDTSQRILRERSIDFLFCGFTLHDRFIDNFASFSRPNGSMFLTKPIDGDDYYLRVKLEGYNLEDRKAEVSNISRALGRHDLTVNENVHEFSWSFNRPDNDKIIAALSIVCLSKPKLLSEQEYNFTVNFMGSKLEKENLVLSQRWNIWEVTKNG